MHTFKKISTFEELDEILPMIGTFHKSQEYSNYFTTSGYMNWLTFSFPLLGIWVTYEDPHFAVKPYPTGYIIVGIQFVYGKKEALVYEAFSELNHSEINVKVYQEVEQWAKDQECNLISCFTESEKLVDLFVKRNGYEAVRTYLTKRL